MCHSSDLESLDLCLHDDFSTNSDFRKWTTLKTKSKFFICFFFLKKTGFGDSGFKDLKQQIHFVQRLSRCSVGGWLPPFSLLCHRAFLSYTAFPTMTIM